MDARENVGLDMNVPIIVFEWMLRWHHWNNKWYDYFPEDKYGKVILDTHIYDFKKTVDEEEKSWNFWQWPNLKKISK